MQIVSARWLDAAQSILHVEFDDGKQVSGTRPFAAPYEAVMAAWKGEPETFAAPSVQLPAISRRQFYQQLATENNPATGKPYITQAEALAAVQTGTIPAEIATLVGQLAPDQQFGAQMLLAGATAFDRVNPLVAQLGAAFGMSSQDLDALWTAAAVL